MTLMMAVMLALVAPLAVTGCKTTSSQAVVYHTLADTQIAVDKAMRVYGALCVQGKVDVNTQARIDGIHTRYRAAFRTAVAAARFDYKTATPDTVALLANEILNQISNL